MSHPTVYSVESANKRLPYIRVIVRDIVELASDLQQRQERLDEILDLQEQGGGQSPHAEEFEQMQLAVEQDFTRFEQLEQELHLIEVNVVDRNTGLVEMQSQLDDQLVWINWQPDEPEYMFWRATDDDAMMRRPLLQSVGEPSEEFLDGSDTDH